MPCADFFGKFYILNNTMFYIDKIANNIMFQAWEDIAISCINIASVRKLELYSADATTNDTQTLRAANFIPVAEDALGAVNNRVSSGLAFPSIVSY